MPTPRAPRPTRRGTDPQQRRREERRSRRLAVAALAASALAVVVIFVAAYSGGSTPAAQPAVKTAAHLRRRVRASRYTVGTTTLHLVDTSRTITLPEGRTIPRTLETIVRYPAESANGAEEVPAATPATSKGPFPLLIFGQGYDTTPAAYDLLLNSWTRAGYVVAAPAFPLATPQAPGGPNEADLVNEPADISFVITHLLEESEAGAGPLAHLIASTHIGVAGQSDGGDAALAAAYDPSLRDDQVDAAAILSGTEIPQLGQFTFPPSGPPLLAVQGTADTVNTPADTYEYYDAAPRPKYLLRLNGGEDLAPYTTDAQQLALVERVTVTFFDAYLKGDHAALSRLQTIGNLGGAGSLLAEP